MGWLDPQAACLPTNSPCDEYMSRPIYSSKEREIPTYYIYLLTLEVMIIKRINPYFSCIESFLENWTEKKKK